MPSCINKVFLLAPISKYGVSLKYAPSGTACAEFSLVLTEQGQDGKYFSRLAPCQVWGRRAEAVSDLEPGQLCLFEGKVASRRKGENDWETVFSGFDVTPIVAAAAEQVAP